MQSHDDESHRLSRMKEAEMTHQLLEAKAKKMLAEQSNKITAGAPGDQPLSEIDLDGIHIRRMPEDEHGVQRISIGRAPAIDNSSYLVYRGEPSKILGLLERAVGALRKAIQ